MWGVVEDVFDSFHDLIGELLDDADGFHVLVDLFGSTASGGGNIGTLVQAKASGCR